MRSVIRVAAVQAESVWLDLEGGVAKTIELIGRAAEGEAQLVAFGETWLPGYPFWIWLDSPAAGMPFVLRYHANSMLREGPEMQQIQDAAARHNIHVVLGFSERDRGTLYIAQAFIANTGKLISVRRKLKTTHVERSLFGEGDGSDFQVHETELGRLGALCCWEHIHPLNKYAMACLDEEIHVASWPVFSLYQGAATALGPEVNTALSLSYAVETQSFVISPISLIGPAAHEAFGCDSEQKRQLLQLGGGFARIYGPDGSSLADPLPETEEGILFADLDPALRTIAKSIADPVGHYSRPDVYRLMMNPNPAPPVVYARSASIEEPEREEPILDEQHLTIA